MNIGSTIININIIIDSKDLEKIIDKLKEIKK